MKRLIKHIKLFLPMTIKNFFSLPYTRPILLTIISLCLLLIITPYIISRFTSDNEPTTENDSSKIQSSFESVDVPETVTIYRTETGTTETIDFEDYIKGVVSCEMPSSFHIEALKAQAVAARTYSTARVLKTSGSQNPQSHPQAPLCDTTHCQVYKDKQELRSIKGKDWLNEDYKKICSAVDDTKGELLYYNGQLVLQALFHSSSGGTTENSEDVFAAAVPYLVSVDSPYEDEATHQNEKTALSLTEFSSKLKSYYTTADFGEITQDNIKIISRSKGGRVAEMQVGSTNLTGRQIREALGLASANFTIDISDDTITFTSNGSGHGVGMSQYGADGMAKAGYDYKEILEHYYSGVTVQ